MLPTNTFLQIHEIYLSLQGESTWAGLPSLFIRTTGCPVRCNYCDTAHAFYQGKRMHIADIIDTIAQYACKRVCVTGGEPLAQNNVHVLLAELIALGYQVSLETSGVRLLANLPRPLKIVLDLKTPGSGVFNDWLPETLTDLTTGDELKVVITNQTDWDWFLNWHQEHHNKIHPDVVINVSPVWQAFSLEQFAQLVLQSGLDLRLNLQLHKIIWPNATQGR